MSETRTATQAVIDDSAEAAAARAAQLPGATPENIAGAHQAVAEAAGRLIGLRVVDNTSELFAAERNEAADFWRGVASDPNATEAQRSEAARQAEGVQLEADGYAGINDPTIRPAGYEPMTDEAIAASRARVASMHRS